MSSANEASRFSGCSTLGGSTIDPRPEPRVIRPSTSNWSSAARAVVRLMPNRRFSTDSDGSASPTTNSPRAMAARSRSLTWNHSGTGPRSRSPTSHDMEVSSGRHDVYASRTAMNFLFRPRVGVSKRWSGRDLLGAALARGRLVGPAQYDGQHPYRDRGHSDCEQAADVVRGQREVGPESGPDRQRQPGVD